MSDVSFNHLVSAARRGDATARAAFDAIVAQDTADAVAAWKARPNYAWLDVVAVVALTAGHGDRWLKVLERTTQDRHHALQQLIAKFLWDHAFEELGRRAFAGDHAERVRLIEELVNWVYAEVRKRKANGSFGPVDTDDAVQTVCLKVWTKLSTYRGGSFCAWVRKILLRILLDGVAAVKRKNEVSLDAAPSGDDADSAAPRSLLDRTVGSDGHDEILRAVDWGAVDKHAIFAQVVNAYLAECPNTKHVKIFRGFYASEMSGGRQPSLSFKQIAQQLGDIGEGGIGATLNRMRSEIRRRYLDELRRRGLL
jgi:RNA polymerase sigma factor (sigma-70 family)